MYKNKSLCVVIPANNAERSIGNIVQDFITQKNVDRVIVVENKSRDNTVAMARDAGASVIVEKRGGFGFAARRGIDESNEDLILLAAADERFFAGDIEKFLAYSKDADLILGTRNSKQIKSSKESFRNSSRIANLVIAKFMQFLYGGSYYNFSDANCAFRLINKQAYRRIRPYLNTKELEFLPEMVCESIKAGLRVIEIPINYGGTLKGDGKRGRKNLKHFSTAIAMIYEIITRRFQSRRYRISSKTD